MKWYKMYFITNRIIIGAHSKGIDKSGFDIKITPTISIAKDVDKNGIAYGVSLSFGVWVVSLAYVKK